MSIATGEIQRFALTDALAAYTVTLDFGDSAYGTYMFEDNVQVIYYDAVNRVQHTLVLDTDYTLESGTLTLLDSTSTVTQIQTLLFDTDDELIVLRGMPSSRTSILSSALTIAQLNYELDRSALKDQEFHEALTRTLCYPPLSTEIATKMLPPLAIRAGNLFCWDTNGNPDVIPMTGSSLYGELDTRLVTLEAFKTGLDQHVTNGTLIFTISGSVGTAKDEVLELSGDRVTGHAEILVYGQDYGGVGAGGHIEMHGFDGTAAAGKSVTIRGGNNSTTYYGAKWVLNGGGAAAHGTAVLSIGDTAALTVAATGAATFAGALAVTGALTVDGNTTLGNANTDATIVRGQLKIGDTSTPASMGIVFGEANDNYDTNLYRSAANILKTDDSFIAGGFITAITGYRPSTTYTTSISGSPPSTGNHTQDKFYDAVVAAGWVPNVNDEMLLCGGWYDYYAVHKIKRTGANELTVYFCSPSGYATTVCTNGNTGTLGPYSVIPL